MKKVVLLAIFQIAVKLGKPWILCIAGAAAESAAGDLHGASSAGSAQGRAGAGSPEGPPKGTKTAGQAPICCLFAFCCC